mmetsp:Transcript_54351/g.90014  ORF Transcript_54351/g.90014 Transcript_54351/m.90014 type:complete len:260 (-) Transcript_54351:63-842(-)
MQRLHLVLQLRVQRLQATVLVQVRRALLLQRRHHVLVRLSLLLHLRRKRVPLLFELRHTQRLRLATLLQAALRLALPIFVLLALELHFAQLGHQLLLLLRLRLHLAAQLLHHLLRVLLRRAHVLLQSAPLRAFLLNVAFGSAQACAHVAPHFLPRRSTLAQPHLQAPNQLLVLHQAFVRHAHLVGVRGVSVGQSVRAIARRTTEAQILELAQLRLAQTNARNVIPFAAKIALNHVFLSVVWTPANAIQFVRIFAYLRCC